MKYNVNCQFPSRAGVDLTILALVVSLMVNLALIMVLIVMSRRKKGADFSYNRRNRVHQDKTVMVCHRVRISGCTVRSAIVKL